VLGGDNRALTLNDTPTNSAAAAAEMGLLNPQRVAEVGVVLGGEVARVAAPTSPRVALHTLGGTQCVRPAGWLAASSLGAGGGYCSFPWLRAKRHHVWVLGAQVRPPALP